MTGMTYDQQTAAMEGLTVNLYISLADRLKLSNQVIDRMNVRERERVRTALVDTMRNVRVNWTLDDNDPSDQVRTIIEVLASAEEWTRNWDMAPGWCCPFCEEVTCDSDCPLAPMLNELEG